MSRYASIEFPKVFSNLLEQELKGEGSSDTVMNQDKIIKKTFQKAYHIVDDNIPTVVETAGCTASVMLQLGRMMYVANAGKFTCFNDQFYSSVASSVI